MRLQRGQKVGIFGGKSWHLAAGVVKAGRSGLISERTLCEKIVNDRWFPGDGRQPGVCRACRRANDV